MKEEAKERIYELIKKDTELYREAREKITEISDCKRCGFCCLNRDIIVTIPELIRICKYTGLKPMQVVVEPKDVNEYKILQKPIRGFRFVQFKCRILSGLVKDMTCQIHQVKPFQCMTYPVALFYRYEGLPTFRRVNEGYIYFSCDRENDVRNLDFSNNGLAMKISVKQYEELWERRRKLLKENYLIGTELAEKGLLLKVIEEVIEEYDVSEFIGITGGASKE